MNSFSIKHLYMVYLQKFRKYEIFSYSYLLWKVYVNNFFYIYYFRYRAKNCSLFINHFTYIINIYSNWYYINAMKWFKLCFIRISPNLWRMGHILLSSSIKKNAYYFWHELTGNMIFVLVIGIVYTYMWLGKKIP